jgi:hypothetical protein
MTKDAEGVFRTTTEERNEREGDRREASNCSNGDRREP